jgi:hypothetical protein
MHAGLLLQPGSVGAGLRGVYNFETTSANGLARGTSTC